MPALSLIAVRGVLGLALALGGVLAATTIATRTGWATAKRALVIAAVIAATWGIALAVAILAP